MTSIHTNAGAISALQTLRAINQNMLDTQRQVASGLRVATASNNAAYWSIATTMRSDNLAISAVQDALGLGTAKVDTAYAGMDTVVDVLKEFKAKLVAAMEDGVDKTKIQEELEQLKDQVVTIAGSASFSGQNWLQTDLPDLLDTSNSATRKSVVASFIRGPQGDVAVQKIEVQLSRTSLFNTTGRGLLQKEEDGVVTLPVPGGSPDLGGLVSGAPSTHAHKGHTYFNFVAGAALSAADVITFDITVDSSTFSAGETYTGVTIDQALVNAVLGKADGSISSAVEYGQVIDAALSLAGAPGGAAAGGYATNAGVVGITTVDIGSDEALPLHPGSSMVISNLVSTLPGNFAFGMNPTSIATHMNLYADASISFTEGFRIDPGGSLSLDITFSGATPQSYTVDKAHVDAALGTTDGVVKTATDMALVMNHALATSGLSFSNSGGALHVTVDPAIRPEQGGKSDFVISNVTSTGVTAVAAEVTVPSGLDFDFLDIDITTGASLTRYLSGLEVMLNKVVAGASLLGSLQMRIDLQSDFTAKLSDSIDSGIGRLVDADMNEASTRLKALQTQEQLAIQSLSIANTNAEQILSLFR